MQVGIRMIEALVTVEKAIELSGLSRTTLWRLEKEGKVKSTRWNRKKMYFRKDVEPMADRSKVR